MKEPMLTNLLRMWSEPQIINPTARATKHYFNHGCFMPEHEYELFNKLADEIDSQYIPKYQAEVVDCRGYKLREGDTVIRLYDGQRAIIKRVGPCARTDLDLPDRTHTNTPWVEYTYGGWDYTYNVLSAYAHPAELKKAEEGWTNTKQASEVSCMVHKNKHNDRG